MKTDDHPRSPSSGRSLVLMLIAVSLVGANMRISVYSVGPLLELIAQDESVGAASLGALVSVPLFAWGIVSAFTQSLSARFGVYRTVLWSLFALAVGTLCRSWPGGVASIWLGTIIIGASLAIGNVLVPAVIRRDFSSRVPLMMGVYTGLMAGVGAVSAGLMVPLAQLQVADQQFGWRFALLLTGLPIFLALWSWVLAYRTPPQRDGALTGRSGRKPAAVAEAPPPRTEPRRGESIWRDGLAWLLGLYMGAQSASFYILATWISVISISHGRPPVVAGVDVMLFQLASIAGSFMFSFVYRGPLQRWLPAALPVLMVATSFVLIFVADFFALATILGGVCAGLSLSVGLTLPLVRTHSVPTARALSGMAQSIGYSFAAIGPITFGLLRDVGDGWLLASSLLLAVGVVQFVSGIFVGDHRRFVLG